jgi:hypothetical protein
MLFSNLWQLPPSLKTVEVFGFLEPKDINKLISNLEYIVKYSKEKEIILLINCSGGFLGSLNPETGDRLNYLEQIKDALDKVKESGKVLVGVVQERSKCYSLATDIYNMCDVRVTHESATFMYHPAILNAKIAGKENIKMVEAARAEAEYILSQDETLEKFPVIKKELENRKTSEIHFE